MTRISRRQEPNERILKIYRDIRNDNKLTGEACAGLAASGSGVAGPAGEGDARLRRRRFFAYKRKLIRSKLDLKRLTGGGVSSESRAGARDAIRRQESK